MKTAVEWLQDTWLNYPDLCSYDKIQEWFEQAKEMEKEQIKNAYSTGYNDKATDNPDRETSKQYYNQTFKSE